MRPLHLLASLSAPVLACSALAVALGVAPGCSSDAPSSTAPDGGGADATVEASLPPATMPDDVYGRASDPLPAGARLVTPDELARLVASGKATPADARTRKMEEAAAARREADDTATIEPLVAARPHLRRTLVEDPPADPTLKRTGDGNWLHTIRLANGKTGDVVTMGRRWQVAQAANAWRRTHSYDGQLDLYRRLYMIAPAEVRRALVDPIDMEADPKTYGPAKIRDANKAIAAKAAEILRAYDPDPKPDGYVSDCTLEFGAGDGSDRSRDDPTCARSATGLFERHVWKGKWFVTCVKDQRNRGTCSAFGDVSATEYWVAKTHGTWANLSEQALYNRARLKWVAGGDYGDGLNAYDGLSYMANEGWLLPLEKSWRYNPSINRVEDEAKQQYSHSCDNYFQTCSDSTHQSGLVCTKVDDWMKCAYVEWNDNPTNDGYRITKATSIWDASDPDTSLVLLTLFVSAGFPVVIGHPITTAWDDAPLTAGYMVYKANDTQRGGHGIHVVGMIDNTKLAEILPSAPAGEGGGYLIIKNSWSRCWGDGGYIYVPWKSIKEWTPDATVLAGVL